MPRRKSTPSKRPLDPSQRRVSKRLRHNTVQRQRTEPLSLSATAEWGEDDALRLQFPVDSSLASSLTAFCTSKSSPTALQLHLTLIENDHVKLQIHDHDHEDADADAQLSLSELFPHTYETWQPHVTTLAEQKLLSLHINAKRQREEGDWSFSFSVGVAWPKYVESCSSRSLAPVQASPRATPMRAMHHVMIWLLKKIHDTQRGLSEEEITCRYRYWNEIEVLYDRFVGPNKAACAQFEGQTFAMPEIYARIDAAGQLRRNISAFEQVEACSTDLLPTLRVYQKVAVSWMLARENPSTQQAGTLPVCVTFSKAVAGQLKAYDPYCAAFHPEPSAFPLQLEQLRPEVLDLSAVRGGILADEMGLGKTVEVIALVLSHRRPSMRAQLLSYHSPSRRDDDGVHQDDENDEMACICGSSDNHPLGLVQCEFCGTWHHQICTGYEIDESGSDSESITAPSGSSRGLWDFDTVRSNKSWSSGGFMCYHCQSNERPSFASRTTLIVSPEPIHAQWENELSRHVRGGALSVMRYPGVRTLKTRLEEGGPSAAWQVLASPGLVLARYDVVLTTYEALAADLRHVPTTEGGDRRSSTRSQSKRYAFVSSPLVALNFWRVCMDEAQVGVENTRLQAALTLSRLSASNRWVVTGTPFSSRVSELFGYLRFLRIPPYTSPQTEDTSEVNLQRVQAEHDERESLDLGFFRESVEHNFVQGAVDRVLDLLLWDGQGAGGAVSGGGILWRTGKRHVLDQLGLPPQKGEVVWCHFAAVERHFYDRQEKHIVSLIQQRQRQSSRTSDVIERDDSLWRDLLVLRQLCCHPQVGGARQAWGSGGNSTTGTVMTMDAFLQELVNKAKRECEEAQRQFIGAQNGLAALLVLDSDMPGAALKYMAEISLIRTNWPHFRADLLPRLHILQNLEKCIQKLYALPGNNAKKGAISSEGNAATVDPTKLSLLPDLPALEKRISPTGLLPDSGDLGNEDQMTISHECALLGQSAQYIRQYYLMQVDVLHAQALSNFKRISQEIATSQRHSSEVPSKMLCTSGGWWNEALGIVEQSERNNEQQLVARVQARLSGFDTRWGTTFCSQLVSTRSLRLLLVRELEALAKRRRDLFGRLEALSDGSPTDADIELSGNCAKCRDGGTGPTCVHCQLYKELEAYRKHFLGIDKTFVGKGRIKDLIDDEELDDDVTGTETKATAEGLSVSLFIEIFKEIASCARSALRSQQDGRMLATNIQISMQTETDFWVKLQREWQAAKKLFQTQHQRLGALDELVMACSQLRLRQPGEPAAHTKAERLYKLERVEVPVRAAELEEERAAADLDLRDKMAQLRYLLQLQKQEKLTMQELTMLLHGDSDYTAAAAGTLFWEELVLLNEKSISRHTAHNFVERRRAAEAREETQSLRSATQEPQTRLFNKSVALFVAKELLDLPYPSDENSGEVIERVDPQILKRYRARIMEEIRVWKATYE
ncbi:hypothetical protein KRP22_014090 [Phytophthora ramorum]|nr:E3 ubiquitin-protein ligase SHPRH [Phytophthora ramorum]